MTITVRRDIAGSYVVALFPPNPWCAHDQAYIDARKDIREPHFSFIEYVRGGRVRYRESIHNAMAPERIMQMVRNILASLPP